MRSRLSVLMLVAVCTIAAPLTAAAQESVTTYQLTLRDGSRIYGVVERQSEAEIEFRTLSGSLITAKTGDVLSLKQVKGSMVEGEFLPDDRNQTRLFFAPTGRSLPKGDVSFGTYEFVMPFVQVGVTDRFSMGGGTPLFFGLDESERPFWLTPKYQVLNRGNVQAAAGLFHIFAGGENAGIAYGVVTIGGSASSLTAGGGMAYAVDGGRSPIVMVGGDRRVRRNLKVLTENYAWKGGGVISAGVRFIGERLSADIGLAVPLGIEGFIAAPVVNFVYVF
jgi:hypothetical protein